MAIDEVLDHKTIVCDQNINKETRRVNKLKKKLHKKKILMVAIVQQPAPAFNATAVVEGQFKDISLSDYLGKWWDWHSHHYLSPFLFISFRHI